mgnify:CR=1 FL=1
MAKEPKTTGEHLVALYGHVKGLKKDIHTIKDNHLKHMHDDIDKTVDARNHLDMSLGTPYILRRCSNLAGH